MVLSAVPAGRSGPPAARGEAHRNMDHRRRPAGPACLADNRTLAAQQRTGCRRRPAGRAVIVMGAGDGLRCRDTVGDIRVDGLSVRENIHASWL